MTRVTKDEIRLEALHPSPPQPLPFAPKLHIRAFLLERDLGNVLVYAAGGSEEVMIRDFGGATRRYLNHWHEAMFLPDPGDIPTYVRDEDAASTSQRTRVDVTFAGSHILEDDFEAIPIPGHTPGATAYLWDTGEHRLLFTGDSLFLDEGEWVAAVLESSDRVSYIESLEAIRELDFDVLVPWAATGGLEFYAATDKIDTRRRVGAVLDRLRHGEDR